MPLQKIKELFESEDVTGERLAEEINKLDHFEVARLLHQLQPDEKVRIFRALKGDTQRQELLYETDEDSRREIISSLDRVFLARFLSAMPEDEATDILKEQPQDFQNDILSRMGVRDATVIKNLIRHGEETAGSLMLPKFNKVSPNQQAGQIIMSLKSENDNPPYFYVVNERSELLGFFKLRDLLNVAPTARAIQFMRKKNIRVQLDEPCERIANLMDHEKLSSLPVVDDNNIIQGIITFDDVIRAIKDLADEDIFTMVGTARVDPFAKRTLRKITARAPWLFTTFMGGIASAFVLRFFSGVLAEFATVIFFVPFVIGLAGNVGIQGSTVIVRGLANGDIQSDNLRTVVLSEMWVGVLNGLIFGFMCGAVIAVMSGPALGTSPVIGLTVGTGIVLAVAMSAVIGSAAPIVFIRLNIDPAISAGPSITVANDIIGIVIYLASTSLIYSLY